MYDKDEQTKMGKLRVFVAKNIDRIDDLVDLIRADRKATGMEHSDEVRLEKIKNDIILEGAPLKITDLKIDGATLILEGIQPVRIGELLKDLWTECVVNPSLNNEEWLLAQIRKKAQTE
jgi:hypothetical protein